MTVWWLPTTRVQSTGMSAGVSRLSRLSAFTRTRAAITCTIDQDETKAMAGLNVLGALLESPMLDEDDVELVATVVGAIARDLQDNLGADLDDSS